MTSRPAELERAFALARSGECAGVDAIRRGLNAEGYSGRQLEGLSLMRQLRDLCREAKQRLATDPADDYQSTG